MEKPEVQLDSRCRFAKRGQLRVKEDLVDDPTHLDRGLREQLPWWMDEKRR